MRFNLKEHSQVIHNGSDVDKIVFNRKIVWKFDGVRNLFKLSRLSFISNYEPDNASTDFFVKGDNGFSLYSHEANYPSSMNLDAFKLEAGKTYTSKVTITMETIEEGGRSAGSYWGRFFLQGAHTFVTDKVLVFGFSGKADPTDGTYYNTFTVPDDMTNYTMIVNRMHGGIKMTYSDLVIVEGKYTAENFPI